MKYSSQKHLEKKDKLYNPLNPINILKSDITDNITFIFNHELYNQFMILNTKNGKFDKNYFDRYYEDKDGYILTEDYIYIYTNSFKDDFNVHYFLKLDEYKSFIKEYKTNKKDITRLENIDYILQMIIDDLHLYQIKISHP